MLTISLHAMQSFQSSSLMSITENGNIIKGHLVKIVINGLMETITRGHFQRLR